MSSLFSGFCRPSRLQLPIVLIFFRSNQFFVALPLALYIILLHLGALTGAFQPPGQSAEVGLLYQALFGWVSTEPFYAAVAAALLVFIQAIVINTLADEFRLMGERNWFPGLFYALTVSALPEFLFISAPLVAATFVPFSLWRIYNAYQKPNVARAILDGALWIGVASLFYPPALWFIVAAFAGFEVVRVFRFHERLVFLIGFFIPLLLGWLWYFWADRGGEFRASQWGNLFQWYHFDAVIDTKTLLKTALIVLLALVFLFGLGSLYSRKGIQSQKFASVLYWFLAVGAVSVLLNSAWHWAHLLLPASSMGIMLSLSFQSMRNRRLAELWHLGILLFVFFIQFADYFLSLLYSVF